MPGWAAPVTSTGVPSGKDVDVQPSVSVAVPVPAQCAAWPMYTVVPLVKTKFAVHCAPAVNVCTPGWTAAVAAGAHWGVLPEVAGTPINVQTAATATSRTRRGMCFNEASVKPAPGRITEMSARGGGRQIIRCRRSWAADVPKSRDPAPVPEPPASGSPRSRGFVISVLQRDFILSACRLGELTVGHRLVDPRCRGGDERRRSPC